LSITIASLQDNISRQTVLLLVVFALIVVGRLSAVVLDWIVQRVFGRLSRREERKD
jgi:hypothetical protein